MRTQKEYTNTSRTKGRKYKTKLYKMSEKQNFSFNISFCGNIFSYFWGYTKLS